MGKTSIEWTTESWNPTRGCSRVSPGCDGCYAMGQARRQDKPGRAYHGLTTYRPKGSMTSPWIKIEPGCEMPERESLPHIDLSVDVLIDTFTSGFRVGCYDFDRRLWVVFDREGSYAVDATHWMPIPKVPED